MVISINLSAKEPQKYLSSLSGINKHLENAEAKKSLEKAKEHWYKGKKRYYKKSKQKQNLNVSKISSFNQNKKLFETLGVGYGGASAYDFYPQEGTEPIWMSAIDLALDENIGDNPYYQGIKDFEADDFTQLQQSLSKSQYIIYWLTKNWDEDWFSIEQIQAAMDEGYVPVFIYWYFGDTLVNSMPTDEEVEAYYQDNSRVSNFLNQLDGQKIIIMEPEFNKNPVIATEETQKTFASILSNAIDTIKQQNHTLLVSLCMTDAGNRNEDLSYSSCGYDNCALGDKYSWSQPEIVYNELLNKIDFVAFQEMVAQFSRDPQNPGTWEEPNPKSYTDSETGINLLAQRINNLTAFLHEKYNKPVFLPYMTIATATWNDTNGNDQIDANELDLTGWEVKASNTYQSLLELKDELQQNGLFGYAPMVLFDHPAHDQEGYQYFLNNEYHLGIIKTQAKDAIDEHLLGDLDPKSNIMDFLYQ